MNLKERMGKIGDALGGLQDKAKDVAETAALVSMEKKDDLSDKLSDAKGSLAAAQENFRLSAERAQGSASSKLLEAQMNFNQAREEAKAAAEEKGKENEAKAIGKKLDYASECQKAANIMLEDARVAMLEAAQMAANYRAKYDEEPVVE